MMHVGTQYFATDGHSMEFLQRFGVKNLDVRVDDMEVATLKTAVAASAKYGISTDQWRESRTAPRTSLSLL